MTQDKAFEAGFDHPCKKTCSGWQQGFERGEKGMKDRWNRAAENWVTDRLKMDKKIHQLRAHMAELAEALEWYGWKMVPECLNSGRLEVTTELGKRARQAHANTRTQWLIRERELMETAVEASRQLLDYRRHPEKMEIFAGALFHALRDLDVHRKATS